MANPTPSSDPTSLLVTCIHCKEINAVDVGRVGTVVPCVQCGRSFIANVDSLDGEGIPDTISAVTATTPDLSGRQFGNYLLQEIIGQGGAGAVYLAEDVMLKRNVAVKILPQEMIARDPITVKRFMQEAQLAAQLNHLHVVQIYYVSQAEGHYFIAMEYVDGGNLEQWVRRGGPPSGQKASSWMVQACLALRAAHSHGVTHRDVKPSNLMLTNDGRIKVTDFGLAKLAGSTAGLTRTRRMVGTPQYMSPEQCRGAEATPLSDVYGLGSTFFYVTTGRTPFKADSIVGIAYKHVHDPVPDPREATPGLDARLAEVIMRCMAKDPADRFVDVGEIVTVLADLTAGPGAERSHAGRRALGDSADGHPSQAVSRSAGEGPASAEISNSLQGRYAALFGSNDFAFHGAPSPDSAYSSHCFVRGSEELSGHLRSGTSLIGLVGAPGSGRTCLIDAVADQMADTHLFLPLTPEGASNDPALSQLRAALGISSTNAGDEEFEEVAVRTRLEALAREGRRLVAVITDDDAFQGPAMRRLGALLEMACGTEGLQLVLVGKPDLPVRLAVSNILPDGIFGSTIVALGPLADDEVQGYIAHRLRSAGISERALDLTPAARELIFRESRGVPGRINRICHNAMALCCQADRTRVNVAVACEAAAREGFITRLTVDRPYQPPRYGMWDDSSVAAKFSAHASIIRRLRNA